MKRRTQAEWRGLFEAQATSGLTAAAFCRKQGVDPKYFSLRRRQVLGELPASAARSACPAFVPVAIPRSQAALEVQIGAGLQLRLPTSVSPQWLADVVRALQE